MPRGVAGQPGSTVVSGQTGTKDLTDGNSSMAKVLDLAADGGLEHVQTLPQRGCRRHRMAAVLTVICVPLGGFGTSGERVIGQAASRAADRANAIDRPFREKRHRSEQSAGRNPD